MSNTSRSKFIKRILTEKTAFIRDKTNQIKSFIVSLADYFDSYVIISLFEPDTEDLQPLVVSEEKPEIGLIKEDLSILSKIEDFGMIYITPEPVVLPISSISGSVFFNKLSSRGYTHLACIALNHREVTVGCLLFVLKSNFVQNNPPFLRLIKNFAAILGSLISKWIDEDHLVQEIQHSNLIIKITEFSLSTTDLLRTLHEIFQDITDITGIAHKAVFVRDITQLNCIVNESVPNVLVSHILELQYQLPDLPFFNTVYPIFKYLREISSESNETIAEDDFAILLPIGFTNVLLGLFLLIGKKDQLNSKNIHLFRVICDLLFVTIQRNKLLDDMQRTIQSAEFASYPVILVNKRHEILYLNERAERLFNIDQRTAINLNIFYLLRPDEEDKAFLRKKIDESISTISRSFIKLSLNIAELGEHTKRTFFIILEPTINNLTREYCLVLSFIDISEAEALQSLADEYSKRADIYFNILTHDIYNILFAISGYYELLKDKLAKEDSEIVKRIDSLISRGTNIVKDIRTLSKILKLSHEPQKYAIPLKMTIEQALNEFSRELEKTEIELSYDINIPPEVQIEGNVLVSYLFFYLFSILADGTSSVKMAITGRTKDDQPAKRNLFYLEIRCSNPQFNKIKDILTNTELKIHSKYGIKYELINIIISEIIKLFGYKLSVTQEGERGVLVELVLPII